MNRHEFTIEVHSLGMLLFGPKGQHGIPIDALSRVAKLMPKSPVIGIGVANALGAVMAIGTLKDIEAWENEIEAALEADVSLPKELKWLKGTKTGSSSRTIFAAIKSMQSVLHDGRPSLPSDADDFSRCLHLVRYMGWESELPRVAETYPEWKPIIDRWPALAGWYDANNFHEIREFLKTL